MKLASDSNETMDEKTFQELNQMHESMEDSGIQDNSVVQNQQDIGIKPINLDDL